MPALPPALAGFVSLPSQALSRNAPSTAQQQHARNSFAPLQGRFGLRRASMRGLECPVARGDEIEHRDQCRDGEPARQRGQVRAIDEQAQERRAQQHETDLQAEEAACFTRQLCPGFGKSNVGSSSNSRACRTCTQCLVQQPRPAPGAGSKMPRSRWPCCSRPRCRSAPVTPRRDDARARTSSTSRRWGGVEGALISARNRTILPQRPQVLSRLDLLSTRGKMGFTPWPWQ